MNQARVLRHSFFLYNANRDSLAVPIFLYHIFVTKLCNFLCVFFQLIKVQIKLVFLDSTMQPAKIMCHGIKDIFCKYIIRSPAQKPGESTVSFNVCKSAFCLDASVHTELLSLFGIDQTVFFFPQLFKQSGYNQFLVTFFQRLFPVPS